MRKIWLNLMVLCGLLVALAGANGTSVAEREGPSYKEIRTETGGMPGRPVPQRPIPHHEPGTPARLALANKAVSGMQASDGTETFQPQGIEALLADGTLSDPLAGNYDVVYLDQLLMARSNNPDTSAEVEIEAWSAFIEPDVITTPVAIAGSVDQVGNTPTWGGPAIAAGDLNGDSKAEQIVAWRDYASAKAFLAVGGLPGAQGRLSSDPAAVAHDDGALDLLARGPDYALWHRHYDGAAWGEWNSDAGGYLQSAPAVAALDGGQFYALARGVYSTTTALYWRRWDGAAWATGWELIDVHLADGAELVGDPTVVAWGADRIDVFCRASDNTLRWLYLDEMGWGSWQNLGGYITSAPAAASWGDNHVQILAEGFDGALWHLTRDRNGWSGWQRLRGLEMTSKPTAVSPATNQMDVYARGADNALWRNRLESGHWSGWQSLGGVLDSGAAAAVHNSRIDLFAQTADDPETPQQEEAGYVQHNSYVADAWSGWQNEGGLKDCCIQYDTGVSAARVALETGYFTGDGREQIVLAYSNGSTYGVKLYDINDGLRPVLLDDYAWSDTAIDGSHIANFTVDVSTGDLDGNGRDEISLVTSGKRSDNTNWHTGTYVLSVTGTDPWTLAEKWKEEGVDLDNSHGAFVVAAGDLDGNGDDELVTAWTRCGPYWGNVYCDSKLTLYNYEAGWTMGVSDSYYYDGYYTPPPFLALAIADLDLNPDQPGAEIIYAGPADTVDWEGEFSIWQANPLTDTQRIEVTHFARESYAFKLATGDFNRDLRPEVAFVYHIDTGANPLHMGLYGYDADVFGELVSAEMTSAAWSREGRFALATGAVTGENLRVGPPTYRREKSTNNIVAILNTPPTHRDTLAGQEYTVGVDDSYSIYEKGQLVQNTFSHSFLHNWNLSIGGAIGAGDPRGSHVVASLDVTYGGHFENVDVTAQSVAWTQSVQASDDDVLLFSYSDYDVWEYPVYADGDRIPDSYLAVVFPIQGSTGIHTSPGNTCQSWYQPTHQVGNLWSYPLDATDFNGYDAGDDASHLYVGSITTGGAEYDWTHQMTDHTSEQLSRQESMGFMAGFEAQVGGDEVEVSGGFVFVEGKTKTRSPFFKGYVKGGYDLRYLFESEASITEETTVKTHIGAVSPDSSYTTEGHLFWAEEGYLKLDHTANPEPHAFWNLYDKADPAFIRPWADGHCDDLTVDRQDYSRDVTIWPYYANRGETVTISATVRNFSNVTAHDVKVRFYRGDPEEGGQQIGDDQVIPTLARAVGPETVSVEWTAAGSGIQRIYAVIDPDNELAEMHDAVTNVNNNQGYNLVSIGKASYLDPAMSMDDPYYRLSYTLDTGARVASTPLAEAQTTATTGTESVRFEAYVPPVNLDEIVLFSFASLAGERVPAAPAGMVAIGDVVALQASQVGSQDETFDLKPTTSSPPAVITVAYGDAALRGTLEADLRLYTWSGTEWVEPSCAGRTPLHLTQDNLFVVPVCETGTFALFGDDYEVFLPLITR